MIHEIFRINDILRRQAERLGSAGYLVVGPDLLGDGPWIGCVRRAFQCLQAQRGRPFDIVESVRSGLAADPECTGRVGVIGFWMGGGFALLSAARGLDAIRVPGTASHVGPGPLAAADAWQRIEAYFAQHLKG